jgi:ATP-dependent protease ClpP protease subunit
MQNPSLPNSSTTIRLFGKVDESMLSEFFRQQDSAPVGKPVVVELSTSGGDADIGRRIAHEIREWRKNDFDVHFLGKTFVYSAGVTIMSAFDREHRFLTADCELLIHERKIKKVLHLDGALRGCRTVVHDVLAEIDSGQRLERAGFIDLVAGTPIGIDDLLAKVLERDWYLSAEEAVRSGLVAAIV